jgi:hypothetical protein
MSVVAQSADASIEILVGDDWSTDGTSAIVDGIAAAYPHLVRVIRHDERLGSGSANCLRLIAEARGKFIAHLDGDDYWLPGKLRMQLAYLGQHPDIDAVYSNAMVIDAGGRIRGAFNSGVPGDFDLGYLLRHGNFLCHGSLLYRVAHREEFLRLEPPFIDYRFHIELARHGRLGYVDLGLVGYRVASVTSMTVRNSTAVRLMYLDALAAVGDGRRWRDDLGRAYAQFLALAVWDVAASGRWAELAQLVHRVRREAPGPVALLVVRALTAVLRQLRFKAGNFVAAVVLRRPLKVYFPK